MVTSFPTRARMRTAIFGAAIVLMASPISMSATDLTEAQTARLAVFSPKPAYPEAARLKRQVGKGMFRLNVSASTGEVTSIKIEKSTGYRILDAAALKALILWRFKPNSITKVRIPIVFMIDQGTVRTSVLKQMYP